MPLRAAVFDFDGVIVDSEPLHFRSLREALLADAPEEPGGREDQHAEPLRGRAAEGQPAPIDAVGGPAEHLGDGEP